MTYEEFRDKLLYLKNNFIDFIEYTREFKEAFGVENLFDNPKLCTLFYNWHSYIRGRSKYIIPIDDLIPIYYNRFQFDENLPMDLNGSFIDIGDYVSTGYFVIYEVISFSSKNSRNLRLKRVVDGAVTYRNCESVIKLMDYSEKVNEYRSTS